MIVPGKQADCAQVPIRGLEVLRDRIRQQAARLEDFAVRFDCPELQTEADVSTALANYIDEEYFDGSTRDVLALFGRELAVDTHWQLTAADRADKESLAWYSTNRRS